MEKVTKEELKEKYPELYAFLVEVKKVFGPINVRRICGKHERS